nr:MAG TPA: ribosome, tRNA, helicase, RIBOSOME [Caudoviricetes sp.]
MFDSSFLDIETHRTLPLLHPFWSGKACVR